jgi:hypothetical protein
VTYSTTSERLLTTARWLWLRETGSALAGFPIFTEDFWLEDGAGVFLRRDDEACRGRATFKRQTKGIPDSALAIIKASQPYKSAGEAGVTPLGLLSSLENADKHRRLLVMPYVFEVSDLPWVGLDGLPLEGTQKQAASSLEMSGSATNAEMHVDLGPRVSVAIKVSDEEGHFLAIPTLQLIEGEISKILRDLEPFVHAGIASPR